MSENKKKLLDSQIELLNIKKQTMIQADMVYHQREAEFFQTFEQIVSELGILKKDYKKWELNKEGTHLQLIKGA